MTTFDERKDSFENKFKHDQELQFRITARRNKLLGLWAAKLMGIEGESANNYAKEIAAADLARTGDDDVVEKLMADFSAKNVAMDERQLRKQISECSNQAREQIQKES